MAVRRFFFKKLQMLGFYIAIPKEHIDAFNGAAVAEPLQRLAEELRLIIEPVIA